jgi:hypothetical protein
MIATVEEKDKLLLMNIANEIIKKTDIEVSAKDINRLFGEFVNRERTLSTLLSLSNNFYHKKDIKEVLEKENSKEFVSYHVNNYNKKRGVDNVL